MTLGTKAPDFTLPDQNGTLHSLHDHKGSWVVVYFYPKDNTPGCTKEACSFRDAASAFAAEHVVVYGISKDSVSSHKRFHEGQHLSFPLLSDIDHTVIEAYGAWKPKKFMGKEFLGTVRTTFLIDPTGIIKKIYTDIDVLTHAQQILSDIHNLV